ncbi:hypothetical protein PR048_000092 [Dryococelus australis]|uniref:Uncharacterized protein n=1 Tax=Dryococelus australis TaxID=614101 RepID=A0ABQ9IDN1_9NEOP|nr:hypothetical protein PR048_000092 [Dryococelus australis]
MQVSQNSDATWFYPVDTRLHRFSRGSPVSSPSFRRCSILTSVTHIGSQDLDAGRTTPGFSHVGIMPDVAAGRRVFLGDFPFPPLINIPALLHLTLLHPQDFDLKTLVYLELLGEKGKILGKKAGKNMVDALHRNIAALAAFLLLPNPFRQKEPFPTTYTTYNCCLVWMEQQRKEAIVGGSVVNVADEMPGSRRMILGHVVTDLSSKMNRTKKLGPDVLQTPLNRCLSTFDITLLGHPRGFVAIPLGFWPRLTSPRPAIQFVPKMFYRVEVGALGGPVQSANIVVGFDPRPWCMGNVVDSREIGSGLSRFLTRLHSTVYLPPPHPVSSHLFFQLAGDAAVRLLAPTSANWVLIPGGVVPDC